MKQGEAGEGCQDLSVVSIWGDLEGAFQSRGKLWKGEPKRPPGAQCTSQGLPWLILEAIWAVCPQVEMHPDLDC
jgi:hypothetical protein